MNQPSKLEHMPPPRTIWMRYTDNAGTTHVMEHIVWDKEVFLHCRASDAANERAKSPGGKGKASVQQITETEYRRER